MTTPQSQSVEEVNREILIDDVVHDLEALDFNSPEARKVVGDALDRMYEAGRDIGMKAARCYERREGRRSGNELESMRKNHKYK